MKCLFFLLIFILLISGIVHPSEGVIVRGQLISAITNNPVAYANIIVENSNLGTASTLSGKFQLKLSLLPVTLKISHIAYETIEKTISTEDAGIIKLTPAVLMGDEVMITSSRAVEGETPIAFSTFGKQDIEQTYSHQDVPMVLNDLPGVYAYSDAGNGVGYSYIKIRGFNQDRIGVILNGIPMNDPEAHAVYWIDHGDILAATSDIQLQRGVGNSLYGTSVFGGTINLLTNFHALAPGFSLTTGYGNYFEKGLNLPSKKMSLSYAGGPWREKGITLYGRFSDLKSEGYRIGSGTQQQSFQFGVEKNSSTSLTRFEVIYGDEESAFSWEGIIPLYGYDLKNRNDRRYNFYADPIYNGGRNDANKDVFAQSVISLQHTQKISDGLFNIILYNVNGDGYYQQFKGESDTDDIPDFLTEYNLTEIVPDSVSQIGLIRKKWLKNGYWGLVYQMTKPVTFAQIKSIITLGGDARFYRSKHFGEVDKIDGGWSLPNSQRYYFDKSKKTSLSFYIHSLFNLTENFKLMVDLKYLGHRYTFDQHVLGAFTQGYNYKLKYDFFDPHVGVRYNLNKNLTMFVNFSTAHREPADADIFDHDDPGAAPAVKNMEAEFATPLTKHEFLLDYEGGIEFKRTNFSAKVNLYQMDFRDELVSVWYRYFDADDVLHANAPKTIHQGIEFAFESVPLNWLSLSGNFAYADNHFVEFFGDSIGWSGWGGVADYSGKKIPAYPALQAKGKLLLTFGNSQFWIQQIYAGKQFIDFMNTEPASIDQYFVTNIGTKFSFNQIGPVKPTISAWIYNLFDTLYETFGYNYYDGWPPYRVDAYWPGATRNYYLTLTLQF